MEPNSKLARFAVHSNHFQFGKVSPKLFRPTKKRSVSTFRVDGKNYEEIKAEGIRVATARQDVKNSMGGRKYLLREFKVLVLRFTTTMIHQAIQASLDGLKKKRSSYPTNINWPN